MTRLLPVVLCALALAPAAAPGNGMFVGAAEDGARSTDPVHAHAKMALARLAGFDTIRMTSIWTPGASRPSDHELQVLRTAAAAGQLHGIRIVLSVYHRDQRTTPRTQAARAQFASYVAAIAADVPWIADFIIGNEPNLNYFWMPQYNPKGMSVSPAAYLALLAQTYDALKAVSPDVNVIGGSVSPRGTDKPKGLRPTHSPARFIPELGRAYRESGRTEPVMDAFAFHPYLIPSRLPPTFRNRGVKNTTIALSDYDKLVGALGEAFDGTTQPGSELPIVYDEFGYQSVIPPEKESLYTNLHTPAAWDAVPEAFQALYYREALAIAQCQPTVAGMLLFHVSDESNARAWQSGVFYADDTPKSSLYAVSGAALQARRGTLARCPATRAKRVNPLREVSFDGAELTVACDRPCTYVARLEPVDPERVVTALDLLIDAGEPVAGVAPMGEPTVVRLAAEPLTPATYQAAVRVFETGRPGTAVVRFGEPFTVAG